MAKDKTREKRRAARLRKSQAHKVDPLEEDEDDDILLEEEDNEDDEDDIVELADGKVSGKSIMKAMDEISLTPMPVSFSELDAMDAAHEMAEKVDEETYNVRRLVDNIVYHPMMSADEKGKAITKVGDEFPKRVSMAMKDAKMEKSADEDIDLIETQYILAKDNRTITLTEKVFDWIEKKKLSYAAEQKLSDSDFALVVEKDGKKIRKYPIHDKAHVRNALARASQQIKAGGEGAADAKAALPKIHAAAKKMGIGVSEKSNSIIVEKDLNGSWRAVMWPTNNFKDLDGEILSEKAHTEYVEWVNKNMDLAPVFVTWHIPGTARKNQVDFAAYEHGYLIMSSPLEQHEAIALMKAQTMTEIGMSHGTIVLERDADDPRVINKYRMVEVSDLPLDRAANPFTDFDVLTKEAHMNTEEYLATMIGPEKAKLFVEKTALKQQSLRKANVEEKEVTKEEKVPEAVPDKVTEKSTPDELIGKIVEQVSKELGMDALSEQFALIKQELDKIPMLESLVKELATTNEEKLAEMIQPPVQKSYSWMDKRPSASKENILKENEEDKTLKKAVPEIGWLSEATGTNPVVTQ